MALTAYVVDERGKHLTPVVSYWNEKFFDFQQRIDDGTYCCLAVIDPYGDTVFNRLQIPMLRAEVERAKSVVTEERDHQFLDEVERLSVSCLQQVHSYVKFEGD